MPAAPGTTAAPAHTTRAEDPCALAHAAAAHLCLDVHAARAPPLRPVAVPWGPQTACAAATPLPAARGCARSPVSPAANARPARRSRLPPRSHRSAAPATRSASSSAPAESSGPHTPAADPADPRAAAAPPDPPSRWSSAAAAPAAPTPPAPCTPVIAAPAAHATALSTAGAAAHSADRCCTHSTLAAALGPTAWALALLPHCQE